MALALVLHIRLIPAECHIRSTSCNVGRSVSNQKTTVSKAVTCVTYMTVVVELVVGQLELVKRHDLFHPLRPCRGWIGVHMYPRGRDWVCFASHHPARTGNRRQEYQLRLLFWVLSVDLLLHARYNHILMSVFR